MAVWSNRILIVLGALGMFIAGILSYGELKGLVPPCGGQMGCAIVTTSEYSKVAGVSVAYVGLLGYIVLFALALARSMLTGKSFRKLSAMGFAASLLGLVFSLVLTYFAVGVLGQKCVWCFSSLGTIGAMTIAHAALLQGDAPEKPDVKFGGLTALAAVIVSLGALPYQIKQLEAANIGMLKFVDAGKYKLSEILPDKSKVIGDEDARVTVIEFADLNCPSCRRTYPMVKETVAKYGGSVRLAFRHFPLIGTPGHETSLDAALISEYAADKGLFWKFLDTVMQKENTERIKDINGLFSVATEVGLDRLEIDTLFRSENPAMKKKADEYFERVNRDMNMGNSMSVMQTPTFIIYAEGVAPKVVAPQQIEEELERPEYRSLIEKP